MSLVDVEIEAPSLPNGEGAYATNTVQYDTINNRPDTFQNVVFANNITNTSLCTYQYTSSSNNITTPCSNWQNSSLAVTYSNTTGYTTYTSYGSDGVTTTGSYSTYSVYDQTNNYTTLSIYNYDKKGSLTSFSVSKYNSTYNFTDVTTIGSLVNTTQNTYYNMTLTNSSGTGNTTIVSESIFLSSDDVGTSFSQVGSIETTYNNSNNAILKQDIKVIDSTSNSPTSEVTFT
jgi:hypothetical protein